MMGDLKAQCVSFAARGLFFQKSFDGKQSMGKQNRTQAEIMLIGELIFSYYAFSDFTLKP